MKSRISFFDWTTFKKDITRFFPLWVLYALVAFLITSSIDSRWYLPMVRLSGTISGYTVVNLVYAALSAQLLFGELFNSRLCNALHAMPVTRDARFGSHICAGLVFSFVPNLVVSLLVAPSLGEFWWISLLWLVIVDLQYLFFFSTASLSVMCSGSRFAMALVYLIFNFLSVVAWWFASMIFIPMMPGVVGNSDNFAEFSPAVNWINTMSDTYFEFTYTYDSYHAEYTNVKFAGFGDGWLYLFLCAGIGIALFALSLLLYRRRKLECAGDFVVVGWVRPVFLVLYTLCCGVFLSIFEDLFGSSNYIIFLALGIFIGFFTGKMLLERTIRVFRKKAFLQFAVFVVAIGIALLGTKADVLGIVRYVPEAQNVESVYCRFDGNRIEIEDTEKIQLVCMVHESIIEDHCDGYCDLSHRYFTLEYRLANGRLVNREYRVCQDSDAWPILQQLLRK